MRAWNILGTYWVSSIAQRMHQIVQKVDTRKKGWLMQEACPLQPSLEATSLELVLIAKLSKAKQLTQPYAWEVSTSQQLRSPSTALPAVGPCDTVCDPILTKTAVCKCLGQLRNLVKLHVLHFGQQRQCWWVEHRYGMQEIGCRLHKHTRCSFDSWLLTNSVNNLGGTAKKEAKVEQAKEVQKLILEECSLLPPRRLQLPIWEYQNIVEQNQQERQTASLFLLLLCWRACCKRKSALAAYKMSIVFGGEPDLIGILHQHSCVVYWVGPALRLAVRPDWWYCRPVHQECIACCALLWAYNIDNCFQGDKGV